MLLFHGSDRSIEQPEIRETNRYLDFGVGFYTSVYATLKLFETGFLDIQETIGRLKTQTLCDQILFHTAKALGFCSFSEARNYGGHHHAV